MACQHRQTEEEKEPIMNTELRDGIGKLMLDTGRAHHKAFEATDGADPEWPIWYAEYSQDTFADQFGMNFTKSQLIYCLMNAHFEHEARASDSDWSEFYAHEIVERFAPSDSPAEDKLVLYHFDGCPYCSMVRSAIGQLGIDVELRDIFQDSQHRDDLVKVRGRATVPVLKITSPDGEERWMPESRDIVSYLQKTYLH
jgi:glutaredoxin